MSNKTASVLYGAIIGDVSGSPYEHNPIKSKDFKFIRHSGHLTDDTVMTIAVADALLSCYGLSERDVKIAVTESMQRWGRKYPHAGYGHGFKGWLKSDNPHPYKSYGNGAAMRVSAVALIAKIYGDLSLTRAVARWTAKVTHNHPESIKSVEAIASAIFLAQRDKSKVEIKSYVENEFGYDLSRTLDEIRPTYDFEVAAAKSVPESIIAFLEAENFEDAIRNAVSLGGDADTQAAIAGSIAEAFFGVPDEFKIKIRKKLPADMLAVLDEINRIVRLQDECNELHGNEQIDSVMQRFRATESSEEIPKLLDVIYRRSQADGCFIVAMEKFSSDDDSDDFKPIIAHNPQINHLFMSVFTNFYEFNKAVRQRGSQLKCTTTSIKNLLETCAKINKTVQNSEVPANMGLAINSFSDEVFGLPADLIAALMNPPKSVAYENLVARAKNRYPVLRDDIKPSDDDKQRMKEFAATFTDKKTFWDALKSFGITWNENNNPQINDMWAKFALSKAIACGFDPNSEVNLFAPVIDGVNICDEINLYTYWQGFGYAKNTPKIKYLLVAQDWGNLVRCPASFKKDVQDMNAGNKNFIPPTLDGMNLRLFELFKILGRNITKPCEDVFFTNFCLGYRLGNESGGMTKDLMMRDADLFRELCEILEPENILCLGRLTSECVYEALTGEPGSKLVGKSKSYNDFLDSHPQIVLQYGANSELTANFYPLAHCGFYGTKNRPFDKQHEDWQLICLS